MGSSVRFHATSASLSNSLAAAPDAAAALSMPARAVRRVRRTCAETSGSGRIASPGGGKGWTVIDTLLLGTGGMSPLPDRWLSALLVRCRGELILFDCGEGTQIVWRCFGWGFRRLGAICISHTHADHIAGLPGLLHSIANAGRTEPVALYGPPGTAVVVAGLRTIAPWLPYELQ